MDAVLAEAAAAADGRDVAALLQGAVEAHREGRLAEAEALYGQVLAVAPEQPDALHFLGVLRHQQGDSVAALELLGRALQRLPGHPDIHNNLGNVHKERGDPAAAEACYRRALALAPTHFHAIGNLAVVLEAQGQLDSAFNAYGLLLNVAPDYAQGYFLLALFLFNHATTASHGPQVVACLRRAVELDPDHVEALRLLGVVHYALGEREQARQVYARWLERDPDEPVARHMLSACGGAPPPDRADDGYVRKVFDQFAGSFDQQLLHNLDYRAPQLVADMLEVVLPGRTGLDVLDAGCGTGLCAPLLRARARHLEGVDLSPGMLERARRRGGYDLLAEAELTAYLQARSCAWDVVVSADTLVYFGALEEVAAAAAGALRPGGWLVFTVEALLEADGDADGADVVLGASGRYRHGRGHLQGALAKAGFDDLHIEARDLRTECGLPVRGWLVAARLPLRD